MGARGLLKMVVALLALIFGSMVLVGEGPEVAMGSDSPELTAEELAALEPPVEDAVTKADESPVVLAAAQAEPAPVAEEPEPVREAALGNATEAAVEAALASAEPTEPALTDPETAAADPIGLTTVGVVLGQRVNVRSGPSTRNGVIGQVVEDQEVEILGYAENGWARILLNGEEGYMSGDFIREVPQG
ncbi:SH3 domain-containing protein [Vannielia litorea]|uniref:SH3 domain-containing protein n=1 Tax=Vannielia litorea TaxID=1217970 RepID=UPI001BCCCB3B|nr:SH3 domain-containing protein [Vannielia litorea]MBS8226275.1 SH3 domain-containing protein [Vannielia litorea]